MEDSEDYSELNEKTVTETIENPISSLSPTKSEPEDVDQIHQLTEIAIDSDIDFEAKDETNREKSLISEIINDNVGENDDELITEKVEESEAPETENGEGNIDESNTERREEEIDELNMEGNEEVEESDTKRSDEEIDESNTERREEIHESDTERNDEVGESNIKRSDVENEESNTERREEIDESDTERREEIDESNTERREEIDESNTERREEIDESDTERREEIDESNTERREEIDESNTERREEIDESDTERNDEVGESNTKRSDVENEESDTEGREGIDESNTTKDISDKYENLKVRESSRTSGESIEVGEIKLNGHRNVEVIEISQETDAIMNETEAKLSEEMTQNEEISVSISGSGETMKISNGSHTIGDVNRVQPSITTATTIAGTVNEKGGQIGISACVDEQELIADTGGLIEHPDKQLSVRTQKQSGEISNFFTVHIQMDDGSVRNQIVTIVRSKGRKPFLGGYRHKMSGIEYHNASVQTRPRPRPPPTVELFSRDTQTFQVRHQKVNTNSTTSTQMTAPGLFVSNAMDTVIAPGKYETADDYKDRQLENIIIIQKYYRRWLAKHVVENRRKERDDRLAWEAHQKDTKLKDKEERIKREFQRRMHPKTRADFDLLYNGLERWRQDQLAEINNGNNSEAEKKAAKLLLLDEETDLLAAIDRHKIDRNQQSKSEGVQKLLNKAAAPKGWKDAKGRKVEMDTPYTIRSRELLDILNSLNMQYLTPDERLDVLLTLKHTVKEHDCKLTRDIIDLVDREADLIMRSVKDAALAGLRKRIVTLFLQYCKTPTFNPEISLLLRVPPDPSVLIGDINYCKYCGRYLHSTDFSLSTKSSKLTICKSCARKENQSRKRQDYSHYRRILKDLQMNEQQIEDGSKIAFIFKQNDIKTLMEGVWDNKSILSECEDLDELIFVRWDRKEHWSPWNTVLLTKDESEAHEKVENLSETYSSVMINRIHQKHVIAKNMFASLEKMIDKVIHNVTKSTVKV